MRVSTRRKALILTIVTTLSFMALVQATQYASADNVNGSPSEITFAAGTQNTDLKVKIVSNTAQSQSGDPVSGCNIGIKNDGLYVDVNLVISRQGLTADPNPIRFDECGKVQTVKLTSQIGGTYVITATVEDHGKPGGTYHLEPFGTVTVIVVDETAPDTSITSKPADPTAKTTASFEFTATEAASTFECAVDGGAFVACTSPASYSGLLAGGHTFQVRAIDPSGNVDLSPASFSWTIKPVTVSLQVTPTSAYWGTPLSASGNADLVDQTALTLEIDWGDGSTSPAAIVNGAWGPISHSYDEPGDYYVTANLMDDTTPYLSSDLVLVTIDKKPTKLSLVIPDAVTGETRLNARGILSEDLPGGSQAPGALITVDGSGENPSFTAVTTEGITVIPGPGGMKFTSCAGCTADNFGGDNGGNNIILHVSPGTEIVFPANTPVAELYIQDMGDTPFKWELWENPDSLSRVECADEPGVFECNNQGGDTAGVIPVIGGPSSTTEVDGLLVYDGLVKLVITEVDGSTTDGFVGISEIVTSHPSANPKEQREINFEDAAADDIGEILGERTFGSGSYSLIGIVQSQNELGLTLQAHFAGNDLYEASDSETGIFNVLENTYNQDNQGGVGGETVTGDGFAASRDTCALDADHDGICSTWEVDRTVERSGGGSYTLFEQPAGDNTPDVYYEIDCMKNASEDYCPLQSDIDAVKASFDRRGIKLHVLLDDKNLPVSSSFHVWSDSDSVRTNDFVSTKSDNYGTSAERNGGTLGQGNNNNLKAKLSVVRYIAAVKFINTGTSTACGSSGIAEFKGNDAVVAKGCGFGTNPREEMRGTIMHEIGHNLGLKHGGGDDTQCKVNQFGVMSYKGQVPTNLVPKPTSSQKDDNDGVVDKVAGVGWILDYNSQALPAVTESDIDDGFVINIDPSMWFADDDSPASGSARDQVGSFKVVWGTPQLTTKVQSVNTGTSGINWDKDANTEANQKMDVNYMSFTIGTKQITTCQPANSYFPTNYVSNPETLTSYDEWAIVRANLDEFASYGSFDGVHTDPDFFAEYDGEIFEAMNSIEFLFPGVDSPLNNVDLGSTSISKIKQGNTVPVKFDLFDGNGNEITGNNAASYHIQQIGSPPHFNIIIQVAQVTGSTPPPDNAYSPPLTSTQTGNADYFTWDGNKWAFQMGTKNLLVNKTYAARISVVFDTGEQQVLDAGSDDITFLFNTVKNI